MITVIPLCTGWGVDPIVAEPQQLLVEGTVITMDSLILKEYFEKYDSISVDTLILSLKEIEQMMGKFKID